MALVLDLVDPLELQGFTREIQLEEERNRFVLANYLPNDTTPDGEIEFRVTRGNLRDADAAKVRAWDTEAPIGSRQGLERIMGELPPISKKMRLGEEERLRRRALERGDNQQIVDAIYDDAANLARGVAARLELFRGEALFQSSLTINENGVSQTVTYGRSGTHSVTAATKWDVVATATPVADMRSWVQTYIDTNGVAPAFALTSTQVLSNLMRNAEIRSLATTATGTPGIVTVETVNAVFAAFGLPPVVPYDVNVRVDGTATRVTPVKELVLMPPADEPLGATLFGTTAEALELVEAKAIGQDQAPGMVATVHKTDDPVATWTKVAAIGLPVLPNPNLTLRAVVLI
jgi:hypothetical protein